MAESCENVRRRAEQAAESGALDRSSALRLLDPRQRGVLILFRDRDTITSHDVEALLEVSQRTARSLIR